MEIKVTLRNPLDKQDFLDYYIVPNNSQLACDWVGALQQLLKNGNLLEKNFCFLGFPNSARTVDYLCKELNWAVDQINSAFTDYNILEIFTSDAVSNNQNLLNHLHNHFEQLQGTVENLSSYYKRADYDTKYAIRQLNNLCHELESLLLSQRKQRSDPEWVRPSQITTFLHAQRYELTDEHRQGFVANGYDRKFGHVYMHWTQIGKTLFEVFRDEHAPTLTDTVCEAITHLRYYSGEFDVEWGNTVTYGGNNPWHNLEQDKFIQWLIDNGFDPKDTKLSLGYLPLGHIDLMKSFGTDDPIRVREILGRYLDIYSIEAGECSNVFDYCWADSDHKQRQIESMKPGYDYSSKENV